MAGDDEVVAGAGRVRDCADRLAPPTGGVTVASAAGPSEDGAPTSPPSQPVGARELYRGRGRWTSATAVTDGARLTARRGVVPCVRRMQMGRSRARAIRGAASERAERTDNRSGERPGVTVRLVTSPSARVMGVPDSGRRRARPVHRPRSLVRPGVVAARFPVVAADEWSRRSTATAPTSAPQANTRGGAPHGG